MCDDAEVTAEGEAAQAVPAVEAPIGESRWPIAIALLAYMAANIALRVWLPHEGAVRVTWLVPAIEATLLVALLVGDPAKLARRAHTGHDASRSSSWSCSS